MSLYGSVFGTATATASDAGVNVTINDATKITADVTLTWNAGAGQWEDGNGINGKQTGSVCHIDSTSNTVSICCIECSFLALGVSYTGAEAGTITIKAAVAANPGGQGPDDNADGKVEFKIDVDGLSRSEVLNGYVQVVDLVFETVLDSTECTTNEGYLVDSLVDLVDSLVSVLLSGEGELEYKIDVDAYNAPKDDPVKAHVVETSDAAKEAAAGFKVSISFYSYSASFCSCVRNTKCIIHLSRVRVIITISIFPLTNTSIPCQSNICGYLGSVVNGSSS